MDFFFLKSPFMRVGTMVTLDKVVEFMAAAHKMSFRKCNIF